MYHDNSLEEHQGINKTIEVIIWSYYFLKIRKKIQDHIQSCNTCHKTKHSRHALYEEMRTANVLSWLWASVAMDFIVKLSALEESLTRVQYNSILIIVNQLTKKVWFISYKEVSNAEELVYTFLQNVTALQELLDKIISDRDKLFTSNFWTALTRQLELSHKLSTAYHSQTDRQIKQMNQVIKQYLWGYVDYQQKNWVLLLSIAQLCYNNSINKTIRMTPFFANHRYNTNLFLELKKATVLTEEAAVKVQDMWKVHEELKRDI